MAAGDGSNEKAPLLSVEQVQAGYGESQVLFNITLQVEAGETYEQLRGVMFECDVTLHRDVDAVAALGVDIFTRYGGGGEPGEEVRAMVARQAPKRGALQFRERRRATWNHRKLGGVY